MLESSLREFLREKKKCKSEIERSTIRREKKMENQVDKGFLFPTEFAAGSMQPWPTINSLSPYQFSANYFPVNDYDNCLFSSLSPLPPIPSSIYEDCLYPRSGVSSDPLGLSALYMGSSGASSPFGSIHAELMSKMSAQEIMDEKTRAASKSHSEAERRRRERINAHLARLRSLLPSTTKTDKASLLAEVIQHVKELKRQTSELAKENPLPTESDELTVDTTSNDDGRFVVKASLCCEDRSDLIPDLIKALKALRLRALKAEITTLGGRVKNILVITGEDEIDSHQQLSIETIKDALKAVIEWSAPDESSHSAGGNKRQRTNNLSTILQQRPL